MGSNLSRKETIREYKERKTPRGVFAMRCTATGHTWVDSSLNLDASKNRLWFTLRHGSHHNHPLQAEWNTHGMDAFQYDILETLKDDVSPLALKDLLKDRKIHWVDQCEARDLAKHERG